MRFTLTLVALLVPGPLYAGAEDVCAVAAAEAAAIHDVPFDLLMAVGRVESGRETSLGLVPWPWTVNAAGDGAYYDSRTELEARAKQLIDAKATNFDLGCFQVNYGWHGDRFPSLEAMIDPSGNADYAARLLRQHYDTQGDWIEAAGAYHSKTGDKNQAYMDKITTALNLPGFEAPGTAEGEVRTASIGAPEVDWFLSDDVPAVAAMGSLVKLACRTCPDLP